MSLGDLLEVIVTSQKRQAQLGMRVSADPVQLVKRFHQHWNELKQVITARRTAIDNALVKYNPEVMGVASKLRI